jgi:hypothetical protein
MNLKLYCLKMTKRTKMANSVKSKYEFVCPMNGKYPPFIAGLVQS